MASLLDIENTLSNETTQEIVIKDWYWNEFLPKIDEDNIRNDYQLVYQSFTINEFMSFPYDITDEKWNWLITNQIVVIDNFSYESMSSSIEKWVYNEIYGSPVYKENIVKYAFSDKFFEDYQKNVIERRKLSALGAWMEHMGNLPHRLYKVDYTTKTNIINDLKKYNYAWPITFKASI